MIFGLALSANIHAEKSFVAKDQLLGVILAKQISETRFAAS
jgi:hypothetical protein